MIRFVSFIGRTHATGCPIQGKPSRPDRSIASCAEMARTCQTYRLPRLPSLVQRSAQGTQPGAVLISTTNAELRPRSSSVTYGGKARVTGTRESQWRSEEHTSELQSLLRISYAVLCLKNK